MGHTKCVIQTQVDNKYIIGTLNTIVILKSSRAIDIHCYWVLDRIKQTFQHLMEKERNILRIIRLNTMILYIIEM